VTTASVKVFPNKVETPKLVVAKDVAETISQFMLDRRTGNVVLNIKDGQIMGLRVEEIVRVK
jgi:hypothetical protein